MHQTKVPKSMLWMTIIAPPLHQFGHLFTRKHQWVILNGFKRCRQDAKVKESTWRVAKRLADNWWINASALVSLKVRVALVGGQRMLVFYPAPWRTWTISKGKPFFFSKHQFSKQLSKASCFRGLCWKTIRLPLGFGSLFRGAFPVTTWRSRKPHGPPRGELRYNLIGDSLSPGRKRFRKHIP